MLFVFSEIRSGWRCCRESLPVTFFAISTSIGNSVYSLGVCQALYMVKLDFRIQDSSSSQATKFLDQNYHFLACEWPRKMSLLRDKRATLVYRESKSLYHNLFATTPELYFTEEELLTRLLFKVPWEDIQDWSTRCTAYLDVTRVPSDWLQLPDTPMNKWPCPLQRRCMSSVCTGP